MSSQRRALSAARQARAEMLLEISAGRLTPIEFVDMARDASWVALRRESLREVIVSAPFLGARRWREIRDRMLGVLDVEASDKDLTVGWLLDPRAGGRRYLAFIDAMRTREPPWPGFPWEPGPGACGGQRTDPAGSGPPGGVG
jgi:hypothetical protein